MLFGLISLLVILVVIFNYPRPEANPSLNKSRIPVAVTSTSFNDFIGQITAVTGQSLSVTMEQTATDGQVTTKQYQVSTDSSTTLLRTTPSAVTTAKETIAFSDLKPGDSVLVAGADNLANLTSFVATRIVKYQN